MAERNRTKGQTMIQKTRLNDRGENFTLHIWLWSLIVLFSISGPKQQVGLKIFKFNTLVSILEELLSFGKVPCNQRFLEPE